MYLEPDKFEKKKEKRVCTATINGEICYKPISLLFSPEAVEVEELFAHNTAHSALQKWKQCSVHKKFLGQDKHKDKDPQHKQKKKNKDKHKRHHRGSDDESPQRKKLKLESADRVFLIICGDQKFRLEFSPNSLEELKNKVSMTIAKQNETYRLEYFDHDFSEFVTLQNLNQLKSKQIRLNIKC